MLNTFNKTMSTALLGTSVVVSITLAPLTVFAHDSCRVNLDAGFSINKVAIEFFNPGNKNKQIYAIKNDKALFVNGHNVSLNAKQKILIGQYSTNIRALIPKVRTIAVEGVDLALEGVNLAFDELLGEGNSVGANLTQELISLREEVAAHYTIDHGFSIGEKGLENDELLNGEFEQHIESAIEKAVMNSMSNIMMAVAKEMMTSGGNSNTFETRMEKFGDNIEHEMETRAEKIERKAENLCALVIDIDILEEQLKTNIPVLTKTNVLTAHSIKKGDAHQSM